MAGTRGDHQQMVHLTTDDLPDHIRGVLDAEIRDKRDDIQSLTVDQGDLGQPPTYQPLPVDQGDLGQPPLDQGNLAGDTRYNIEIKVSKKNESLEEEEDDFWMS